MARLTKPITGVVNGEVYPREFPVGADCPPELEEAAAVAGALESDERRVAQGAGGADAKGQKAAGKK